MIKKAYDVGINFFETGDMYGRGKSAGLIGEALEGMRNDVISQNMDKKVPKERISEVGETLGAFPQVSHCYERPSYPDWPYNVFSMIHCTTKKEAHEVAETIQKQVDVAEYMILFSLREFKKIRVEYFMENKAA